MSQFDSNDMEDIPPFSDNGEPVAVSVPPVRMLNFPYVNPEEELD